MWALVFGLFALLVCLCASVVFYVLYPRFFLWVGLLACAAVSIAAIESGNVIMALMGLAAGTVVWHISRPHVRGRIVRRTPGECSAEQSDPELRVKAKEVIRAVQSGMPEEDLIPEFGLSSRDLQTLFQKMNAIGVRCSDCGHAWISPSPRCPNCGAETGFVVGPE